MIDGLTLERSVQAMASHLTTEIDVAPKLDAASTWLCLLESMLSSQVRFEIAQVAAYRVHAVLFSHKCGDEQGLASLILEQLTRPTSSGVRYRFPNMRAKQVATTWLRLGGSQEELTKLVLSNTPEEKIREQIIDKVSGFGMKQASMFLRDVGKANNLAIIDRHVLSYVEAISLTDTPANLTHTQYRRIESVLREYAWFLGYPISIVDQAIWLIVRAIKAEAYK